MKELIFTIVILVSLCNTAFSQSQRDSIIKESYLLDLNRWSRYSWVDSLEHRVKTEDYHVQGSVKLKKFQSGSAILEFTVDTSGVPLVFNCMFSGTDHVMNADIYECVDIDSSRDSNIYQIGISDYLFAVYSDFDYEQFLYRNLDIIYPDFRLLLDSEK